MVRIFGAEMRFPQKPGRGKKGGGVSSRGKAMLGGPNVTFIHAHLLAGV